MSDFSILDFDTKLFGFKVARLTPAKLNTEKLQALLQELKAQKVKLVYWLCAQDDLISQQAAQEAKGFLADLKTTFLIDLNQQVIEDYVTPATISFYQAKKPNQTMEELAFAAGTYSHFKTDPKFPHPLFLKLYKKWIANSVNGTLARHVLVFRDGRKIGGMVTLGEKNGRGDIGLLAVMPEFRGRNVGTILVCSAQKQFLQDGYKLSQVVTQRGNLPACHLYEKCGYHMEKVEHFYHFWL
jgi:dTDP-4-amino-4,6-dideoxy-D-galactose acyltransferase